MKKPFIKEGLCILIGGVLLSSNIYAKDQQNITLSQEIQKLGDEPFYEDKAGGKDTDPQVINYKYESLWFWLSDSEKERRLARNIANRNAYLKKSGLFPTTAEIKSKEIKARQADLQRTLKENRERAEAAARTLEAKKKKLAALQQKQHDLALKRNKLLKKTRAIFASSEIATSGAEPISESVSGIMKGNAPTLTTKQEDKILAQLEDSQAKLRAVIKESRGLSTEISATAKAGSKDQATYAKMSTDLAISQKKLDKSKAAYGRFIANIPSEKKREAARLKLLTQKSNIQKAEAFVKAKLKEIDDQDKLSHFILRDMNDVKKDLKINELEARGLLNGVNQKIQQSILGKYIRAQNQKTLDAALVGACQTAKLCSEHSSINNSNIRKNVKPVYDKLKKELDSGVFKQ